MLELIRSGTSTTKECYSTHELPSYDWHHWAHVNNADGSWTLVVDGRVIIANCFIAPAESLSMDEFTGIATTGPFDDLRVYSRALATQELYDIAWHHTYPLDTPVVSAQITGGSYDNTGSAGGTMIGEGYYGDPLSTCSCGTCTEFSCASGTCQSMDKFTAVCV
jgi:hypothetical protein